MFTWLNRLRSDSRQLATIHASAASLLEDLRGKWEYKDDSALNVYLQSFIDGFSVEWLRNPQKNGFTSFCEFPELGKFEIIVRKVDGQSVPEILKDLTDRLNAAEAAKTPGAEGM